MTDVPTVAGCGVSGCVCVVLNVEVMASPDRVGPAVLPARVLRTVRSHRFCTVSDACRSPAPASATAKGDVRGSMRPSAARDPASVEVVTLVRAADQMLLSLILEDLEHVGGRGV